MSCKLNEDKCEIINWMVEALVKVCPHGVSDMFTSFTHLIFFLFRSLTSSILKYQSDLRSYEHYLSSTEIKT